MKRWHNHTCTLLNRTTGIEPRVYFIIACSGFVFDVKANVWDEWQ